MSKKERADQLVYEQGLAESREQAKRLIMAGKVYVAQGVSGPEPVAKPGTKYSVHAVMTLQGAERFVSRGGYKLLTAMEAFSIAVQGMVVLDAGASTGGFTDCLLQHGAARVYAVDVGRNQLHERLRADARVINMEGVNLRTASADMLSEQVDMIVADVSFISLTLILPPCVQFLRPGGMVAALVKPQFEVGPGQTVKGVVRDEALRKVAVAKVLAVCTEQLGLELLGVVPSAIKGPKGNQEYMICLRLAESRP